MPCIGRKPFLENQKLIVRNITSMIRLPSCKPYLLRAKTLEVQNPKRVRVWYSL